MMLCCLHDGFNGTVGLSLSQVFLESSSEDGQLAIGLEATEGFLGLQQAGGGPSERHLGVSPAFDVHFPGGGLHAGPARSERAGASVSDSCGADGRQDQAGRGRLHRGGHVRGPAAAAGNGVPLVQRADRWNPASDRGEDG